MAFLFGTSAIWLWLVLGLALIAAEALVAPGAYLLWIGLAALAMAGIQSLYPLGATAELLVFGGLAILFALIGWRVYHGRIGADAARELHDPASTFMGRVFVLTAPIVDGAGQVRVDDSIWRVSGADLPAGAKVRVIGIDGSLLLVKAA